MLSIPPLQLIVRRGSIVSEVSLTQDGETFVFVDREKVIFKKVLVNVVFVPMGPHLQPVMFISVMFIFFVVVYLFGN